MSRYRDSNESKKPGYLARRFAAIRRLQRMQKRQAEIDAQEKVQPIEKGKRHAT